MTRQLIVLALVFIAIMGTAMAQEAPSSSPKSSPSPKFSPSPKSSTSSSAESPLSSPPAPTPSEESDISAPPAPASDPIELFAPEPQPSDTFSPEESDPADVTSGVSTHQFSVAVTAAAVAGFFAF